MTGPPIARSFDGFAGHTARAKESLRAAPHDADPTPGPTTAFEAAYAEHFGFVWRSLRGLGVPTASLDDAAQDVFVLPAEEAREPGQEQEGGHWVQLDHIGADQFTRMLGQRHDDPG